MPIHHRLPDSVTTVIRQLRDAGFEAYLVGGAVRDLLLDIEPKDYDLATNATPEQVKAVFRRRARIIGRRFRLAHVYLGRQIFEISTFRRRPSLDERRGRDTDSGLMVWRDNEYGTLAEDAQRRDFTVNAIYFDPLRDDNGVVDHVGGMADLEAGRVRAIGDPSVRLQEDPVRMLRACKLAGQYAFHPDDALHAALRKHAPALQLSSHARLLEELYKILKKPFSLPTFAACRDYGLLGGLLPMVDAGWDGCVGERTRRLLNARDRGISDGAVFPSRVTGLGALALPAVAAHFGDGDDGLWRNYQGIDRELHHYIRDFFAPYQLPRSMSAKARDVLLMLPKFHERRRRGRMRQHPEYPRARDLFAVYVEATELSRDLLAPWPRPEPRRRERRR